MERGRSRTERSGCLGRIFGFVLFLIVAAVGVIAAVKYMPSREGRIWMLCTRRAAATVWRCI